jgi:protease-4
MKPEERELFQQVVNEMYDRFVSVVDAGRTKLDEPAVRRLADGRVYTAKQALEAGLIDRIATLREAVGLVKERVGSRSVRLVRYHRWHAYRPNYYAAAPDLPSGPVNLLNVDLRQWRASTTPQFLYLWAPGR